MRRCGGYRPLARGEVGRGYRALPRDGYGARPGGGTASVGEGVTSQGFQNFQNGVRRRATVDGGEVQARKIRGERM